MPTVADVVVFSSVVGDCKSELNKSICVDCRMLPKYTGKWKCRLKPSYFGKQRELLITVIAMPIRRY